MDAKPFLKNYYQEQVVPQLRKTFELGNPHQVPSVEKVVINSAFGADEDRAYAEELAKEIGEIAGQRPVISKARQSVSNFKLRQGMPIGVKVTLRGARMYDFLYRLMAISLPTIRDFQGVSSKMDGQGNYNLGIDDYTIFPEVNTDGNRKNIGMDIAIVTTANDDEQGRELLRLLGMPFRNKKAAEEPQAETAAAAG